MDPALVITTAVSTGPVDSVEGRRLLVLLHGLGADERDLLPLAAAFGDHVVVSLRAPLPYGPGAAWAAVDIQQAGRGIGLGPAADAVGDWLEAFLAEVGTPSAIRLLGFSQGGAVALTLLRRHPERFDRVAVLAGFVPDEPEAGDARLAELRPPVFWGRGDADPVIPGDAVARTSAWISAHAAATIRVYPGLAHGIDQAELADVARFLEAGDTPA